MRGSCCVMVGGGCGGKFGWLVGLSWWFRDWGCGKSACVRMCEFERDGYVVSR